MSSSNNNNNKAYYDNDGNTVVVSSIADSEPFDITADENQQLYGNGIGNVYDRKKHYRQNPLSKYYDLTRKMSQNERSSWTSRVKSASTQITKLAQDLDPNTAAQYKLQYTIAFKIYNDAYENRLANAFFFDDVINAAVRRLAFFVLGNADEMRATLYPNTPQKLSSEVEAKGTLQQTKMIRSGIDIGGSVLNNQLTDQEIQDIENTIHYVDYTCNLPSIIEHNFINSYIFGRSASLIDYSTDPIYELNIPANLPIAVKPLKSQYLGNVLLDPLSWEVQAVQYKDPKIEFLEEQYVDPYSIAPKDSQGRPVNEFDPAPPASASNWGQGLGISQQRGGVANDPSLPNNGENSQYRFIDSRYVLYFVKNNNNMMRDEDDFYFGHSTLQSILSLSEENRRINRIVLPQLNQSHWSGSGLFSAPNWNIEQMSMLLSGFKPGGYSAINQVGLNFQEIKLTHDYIGLLQQQDYIKKRMLSVMGIPSFLMNFEDVTNRATAELVLSAFNESIIQSERSWICKILDDQWYPRILQAKFPKDQYAAIKMKVMLDFDNITFETFLEKAAALSVLIPTGLIKVEEARAMLKIPTLLPNAEQNPFAPNNPVTNTQAGTTAPSSLEQAASAVVPPTAPTGVSAKTQSPSALLSKYLGNSF
jgi:hypothetical protein